MRSFSPFFCLSLLLACGGGIATSSVANDDAGAPDGGSTGERAASSAPAPLPPIPCGNEPACTQYCFESPCSTGLTDGQSNPPCPHTPVCGSIDPSCDTDARPKPAPECPVDRIWGGARYNCPDPGDDRREIRCWTQ